MANWGNLSGTRYWISEIGEIKYVCKNGKENIVKSYLTKFGYKRTQIFINDCRKNIFVHVLVAKVFIPNPQNKPFINHINCDRSDNRVENLEWATRSENNKYARTHGAWTRKPKPLAYCTKLNKDKVLDIFNSKDHPKIIAAKHGVYWSVVYKIKAGEAWSDITGMPKKTYPRNRLSNSKK